MAHTFLDRPSRSVGDVRRGFLMGACTALTLLAITAFAEQDPSAAAQTSASVPSSPDFMLGRPRAAIGMRGNWHMASAGSDIFDFVTDQLTLEKSSFNTGSFALEFAANLTPRVDLVAGVDLNRTRKPSQYRDFIDNRGQEIEQTTTLNQVNFTGSLKFALLPKGRNISRLAWIPRTVVPYVGAGGGIGSYKFEQFGDFVDFQDNRVFADLFQSNGWAPIAHVFGGTDIQVLSRMLVSFEGRYSWSRAGLDQDFVDFDPIDLGGLKFGVGLHFIF
jgi:hypothetical protein